MKKILSFFTPKKFYKFCLFQDFEYTSERLLGIKFKNKWCRIECGTITIYKGYAWDGCSPKFKIFGRVFGTPDGRFQELKNASLVHDIFCQFSKDIDITKVTVNNIFKDMMINVLYPLNAMNYFGWLPTRFRKILITFTRKAAVNMYYTAVNIHLKEENFGGFQMAKRKKSKILNFIHKLFTKKAKKALVDTLIFKAEKTAKKSKNPFDDELVKWADKNKKMLYKLLGA